MTADLPFLYSEKPETCLEPVDCLQRVFALISTVSRQLEWLVIDVAAETQSPQGASFPATHVM